ncbi:shikimate dehydrogenase, partial [Francisella tularensis subsp. holarctica]|nr:shikimate dehydrogenase [Francisella tularensis subsp. holarctica]
FEDPYDLVIDATPISSTPEIEKNTQFIYIVKHAKIVFCNAMPEKDNKTNYLLESWNQSGSFYISGEDMYIARLVIQ